VSEHELYVRCTLWSANADRNMHWARRNELVGETRLLARQAAKTAKLPHLDRARIVATPHQARGTLADPGNSYPPVKAIIDGLVDAGVFDNDTLKQVVSIEMMPPVRCKVVDVGVHLRIVAERRE
jgi:hypothetical protein